MVPYWDPDLAAAEIRRVAGRGAKGITFPEATVPLGLPGFHGNHWEPVWDALEETGLPVSLHFGSSGYVPSFGMMGAQVGGAPADPDAPFAVAIALFATNQMWTAVDLMFSGVLQRHPRTQDRARRGWHRVDPLHQGAHRLHVGAPPLVPEDRLRHPAVGALRQALLGLLHRRPVRGRVACQFVGIDRITLEIDYPHSDSMWPNSRKHATEVFRDVSDDEVHKMVELNARALYNFPR